MSVSSTITRHPCFFDSMHDPCPLFGSGGASGEAAAASFRRGSCRNHLHTLRIVNRGVPCSRPFICCASSCAKEPRKNWSPEGSSVACRGILRVMMGASLTGLSVEELWIWPRANERRLQLPGLRFQLLLTVCTSNVSWPKPSSTGPRFRL